MKLFFRADASVGMGTGHVMRCLALAQAWQDAGGSAVFAMAEVTPSIQSRLRAESCTVLPVSATAGTSQDAQQTIALARQQQADWIVVDGYQFAADYQRALKDEAFKILFFDDYGHATYYASDLVLNQNAYADESAYPARGAYTRLLLGSRYCLLRREFAAWRNWTRENPAVCRRLLVVMGGSDAENLTGRVLEALALIPLEGLETTVVVGGSNPHLAALQGRSAQLGRAISLRNDISNMAELMAQADLAISGAGSTCWELCLMGLPSLLLDVAPNQTRVAHDLDRKGCAIYVGDHDVGVQRIAQQLQCLLRSQELRQSLSQRSRALVDGNGARRVVSAVRGKDAIWLRRARKEDSRQLWEWANDPEVRAASFSSDPIPWDTHDQWFAGKLGEDTSLILIAENQESIPAGQIRFDGRTDGDWEVDVSIAPSLRGRGLASSLITLGIREIVDENPAARIHAFVKQSNTASLRAFERACFTQIGVEQMRGHAAVHLVYGQPGCLNP